MANGTINLDTSSYDSIQDTVNKINEMGCMQFGHSSEGEDVTMDVTSDGEGDVLHTATYQKNGWVRHNYYHLSDGTVEETYKRE